MDMTSLNYQASHQYKKDNELSFARVCVSDTKTGEDWNQELAEMKQGRIQPNSEYWYMDDWKTSDLDSPVRLCRHRRTSKIKHRANWWQYIELSDLYFTPHALEQYRVRTGHFMDPSDHCWDIPYIPFQVGWQGNTPLTNLILPTHRGAWLGYSVMGSDSVEVWRYKSGRLKNKSPAVDPTNRQFYALTFITTDMFRQKQKEIVNLYHQGDYDGYNRLLTEYCKEHPNSIFI